MRIHHIVLLGSALSLFLAVSPVRAAEKETPDLPNFHTVGPRIWRGAAPTVAGLQKLRAMGVHTIIDLRISPDLVKQEKVEAQQMGFTWINLPMGSDPPTPREVSTFLAALKRAPQEPVFVHCQHGADRTGGRRCVRTASIRGGRI
jgi:protein tyrosine phosphatase (PTP) superfamily phosphohydrolase (DUF442 family)